MTEEVVVMMGLTQLVVLRLSQDPDSTLILMKKRKISFLSILELSCLIRLKTIQEKILHVIGGSRGLGHKAMDHQSTNILQEVWPCIGICC